MPLNCQACHHLQTTERKDFYPPAKEYVCGTTPKPGPWLLAPWIGFGPVRPVWCQLTTEDAK